MSIQINHKTMNLLNQLNQNSRKVLREEKDASMKSIVQEALENNDTYMSLSIMQSMAISLVINKASLKDVRQVTGLFCKK